MADMRTVGEYEVVVNAEEYATMLEDQHSFFLKTLMAYGKSFLF